MKNKGIKICILIGGMLIFCFIFIRIVTGFSDEGKMVTNIKANQKYLEQARQNQKETTKPKEPIVVAIDAGHGGNDCGAIACDKTTYEKDINLFIALELEKLLKDNQITVVMTRRTDQYVSLEERADVVNKANANLLVSIHCNSLKDQIASGLSVYYNESQLDKEFCSKQFSTILADEIKKVVPYKNRGIVKGNSLYIVRSTNATVALAEIGFISYKKDFNFIKEKANQKQIAKSLFNGIMASLPYMEGNKSE